MIKSRSKKAFYNLLFGLIYEAVLAIGGILIPRFIILYYGSSVNGMIGSITQFLSVIALLKAGVGGVTRAALYRPLSNNDKESVDSILKATQIFMRKIAFIFGIAILVLACTYYFIIGRAFSWHYCFLMVVILGAGTFSQYFFGMTSQLLLQADQKNYIWNIFQTIATLANIIISLVLIFSGQSIEIVKIGTAIVFCLCPIILSIFVRKKYKLNFKTEPNNEAIKQRWNAFGYQIATYIHENTDVVILTFFSTLSEVSVYNVYSLIINSCIRRVIETSFNGFDSAIGDIWAKQEIDNLKKVMLVYEFLSFVISSLFFACTLFLLPSFIDIYTQGVSDYNYSRFGFSVVLIVAELFFCFRMPYYSIITALGHYKETRIGAYIEAFINIFVSLILIWHLGILGVAIGTLCAMVFRFIYLYLYTDKKIIKRYPLSLCRYAFIGAICFLCSFLFTAFIPSWDSGNIILWFTYAATVFLFNLIVCSISCFVFAKQEVKETFVRFKNILSKKRLG